MGLQHKQRLSVLLFGSFAMFSLVYVVWLGSASSMMLDYELLSISSSSFSVGMLVDKVSLSFGGLVTLISGCVFMFARTYMKDDIFYYRFMWILLSFVLSMLVLIFSGSFLTMMVGWDGLGVSSFALIVYYQSKDSLASGFLTLLINRLGDLLIMVMLFFYTLVGSTVLVNYPMSTQWFLLVLLATAALTKSAQYPFSVWLPAAMAAPTPVSALVHSSTLVTAGIYIIIRATMSMELPSEILSLLLFCGGCTTVLGGLCAVMENDLKKIIALSTLSQLGVMVFSLGINYPGLALLHLYAHAMFKALLFLVAGVILLSSYGVQDVRLLGGISKKAPLLLTLMNISTFCLMGLPFMSTFYSKHLVLSMMWEGNNLFSVGLMLVGTGLTSVYMIRLLKCMNWGSMASPVTSNWWSLSFYLPLLILFISSLLTGSMFFYMDSSLFLVGSFLPEGYDTLLTLLLLLGVLGGCWMYKSGGHMALTNMWFLGPVWYQSPGIYAFLSTKTKSLDYGWLEPNCLSSRAQTLSIFTHLQVEWPKSTLSVLPYSLVFMGSSILLCLLLSP